MTTNEESGAGFPQSQPVDRSTLGLQYQESDINATATGSQLGVARRVAPHPSALFSHPPTVMSQSQMGGGGNARSVADFTSPQQEGL